jgi:multidrug efflux pump subunit AcrB
VLVELVLGADQDRALNDAKSAIDRITSFPQDAERPVVSLISNRTQAISLVLYGDLEEATLRALAEDTRRGLLADPRVTYVEISGTRALEISIEVPEAQLRQYGLTIDDIANRVRAASLELPAGTVRTTAGEILLRTTERRDRGNEFGDIAVLARPDGTQLMLRDIATIRDGFSEDEREVRFNGQRAVMVSAFRVGNETPLDVAAAVKEYAARAADELPAGVNVTTWADMSEMYADRIDLLRRNALQGLVLVLIILGCSWRRAGVLGDARHPDLVRWLAHLLQRCRRLHQHDLALRVHRDAGHGGGRRHRGGRVRLLAEREGLLARGLGHQGRVTSVGTPWCSPS